MPVTGNFWLRAFLLRPAGRFSEAAAQTRDPDDMARLTEEPDRKKRERIAVIKI